MKPTTRQLIEVALRGDETVAANVRDMITSALDGHTPTAGAAETEGPLLMTMTDAAGFLGVSRVTIWRMVKQGALRPVEIRRGVFRIRRSDLHRVSANYAPYSPVPRGRFAEDADRSR
ncbi:MAG: hypothetical protein A3K18_18910 [Lentisphaerae bacterium RIFOXYA12_64_32]|nr:MAG: hypothetical protein A3K18_18910 [Lentisphaerae bacterium RIFOXYA12_64_32]